MEKRPKILVAGILDTKGNEIRFIADQVRAAGGEPTVLELSVGAEVGWADIPLSQVASRVGKTKEELFAIDRGKASDFIAEGGKAIAQDLLAKGQLDGMIAFGGSMGTSIATRIMQSLPIGVPKVMLSTMTSGDVRPYVGTKDIAMLYPIAEVGLNRVTRRVLNNAAAAVVGMAKAPSLAGIEEKPLIGCMMFGVTTPCVLRASHYFEERGYDVMVNHAVGSGGQSMEELIRDGYILGILDITTHELTDLLCGGVLSAGPERMTAAGKKGIPQVVSVGGADIINFGPRDTVPQKLIEEIQKGVPGRGLYLHNPTVTCVAITLDEAHRLGAHMGEKLNLAQGPAALCVPLRGWSAVDIPAPNKDLGWAGPGPGPAWIPDPQNPQWDARDRHFLRGVRETADLTNPQLDVLLVDKHMNEPEFADFMSELLEEMLAGKWQKGSHHDRSYVLPLEAV